MEAKKDREGHWWVLHEGTAYVQWEPFGAFRDLHRNGMTPDVERMARKAVAAAEKAEHEARMRKLNPFSRFGEDPMATLGDLP